MPTMELFRGDGRLTWQLRITDHRGFRRQLSLRTQDRGTALTIAHRVERLVENRMRGDGLPADLVQWLAIVNKEIREKLTGWEVIEPRSAHGGKPLYNDPRPIPLPIGWRDPPPALVDLWEQDLQEREVTESYAEQSAQRLRVLFALPVNDHRPIRYLSDVTAEGLLARIRELRRIGAPMPALSKKPRRPFSPQTCEHYLGKAREFFGWLVTKGYAHANPAAGLVAYSAEVIAQNKKRDRRALSLEEQATLIAGTPNLPRRWSMGGAERALLYRVALRTGLRANELQTLRVANFNLFSKTLTVLAPDAKASREETLPVAEELVALLRAQFAGKHPQARAFTELCVDSYCKMLQQDLEDLGIAYEDHLGKFADFHALRHTYGTELAKVVMPAIHQKLMRHADITTTMKFYVHQDDADKAAAVAKLPALPAPPASADQAAG